MENESILKSKLGRIERKYLDTYNKCKEYKGDDNKLFPTDDRKLFIDAYENIVKATKEFYSYEIDNLTIHVAFSDKYRKELTKLDKMKESLQEKKLI